MQAAMGDDFYEDDESLEEVLAAWDRGIEITTGQPPSVLDIAEALLQRLPGNVDGWRLEKLCYFVQAHHLATTGLPAFRESIEAWTHGPVIDRLYQAHKKQGNIESVSGDASVVANDPILLKVVNDVVAEFKDWTGPQLQKLTHSQSPWLDARIGLRPYERSRNRVPVSAMRDFFSYQETLPEDDPEEDCPF